MQEKGKSALGLVLVLAVAVALSGYALSTFAAGQSTNTDTSQEKTLYVSGIGTVKAAADQVSITLGVVTQTLTAQEAVQENAAKMTAIVTAIKNIGISGDDISTSYFNLYPVYSYDKDTWVQTQIIGYRVENTITVTTKVLDNAGPIIDTATSAGANQVNSISFQLSDETQKQLQSQALTLACQNAKEKANTVANALGVSIVGVKTINTQGVYPYPIPVYKSDVAGAASTPILPGLQEYTVTVDVVYLIG
jgi:hypothetical protein